VAALIALRRSPKSNSGRIPRPHAVDNAKRSGDAVAVTSRRPPVWSSVR
jgi:hypothetical protein